MTIENRIQHLLSQMTLREKIGQMVQVHSSSDANRELVRQGLVGSLFNEFDAAKVAEFQRVSTQESRLGIPLLIARDVIHGYHTIFPIPLGQAASWNTDLVEKAARTAAREVSATGVRWTFSPMVDIARDPRWGRIAEGAGEDPVLAGAMGAAMVRGYQGDDLSRPDSIAACAKHFVGYGATEGGRDYNTADIPERTLRDVYLKPFQACVDAGVCTLMSGFNEIDGVPASGNAFTLRQILRDEWKFDGFVVSDWTSIQEMIVHGFCADSREAAREGVLGGVSMEMESTCYLDHLESLVSSGEIPLSCIDDAVRSILRIKFRLGLFENPLPPLPPAPFEARPEDLDLARQLARESCVLLKNEGSVLPLRKAAGSLAVIGALADSPLDQIGCWAFDRHLPDIRTPLAAIRDAAGESTQVHYVRAFTDEAAPHSETDAAALQAASACENVVLFLGEGERLSGESHCRAFLDLPEHHLDLVKKIHALGKPVVVVLITGRPLTIPWIAENIPGLLVAWHPGTMGGPAIADLLFGDLSPSGKLPVTFPRTVGQIPLYYNHKNTGRPPIEVERKMPMGTPLDPVGFCSCYLDAETTPQFPFGFGLSYSMVSYGPTQVKAEGESFRISAQIANTGSQPITEVVQLYIRDLVGSVTRPVKELKAFQRIALAGGEAREVSFLLNPGDLAFHHRDGTYAPEAGEFDAWVAPHSQGGIPARFVLS
ncbi:MAG: glycosyl hydrolase [Verrucomicrobia bacterium 61-8]|nr:glycoside hydrolase family 3 C-terminal domain-containing protein [Verrucomicrobiota bacterium]OJV04578.1 MAG: glycosyl hydrolase [Verrucomicrobia bacterium 61-8]